MVGSQVVVQNLSKYSKPFGRARYERSACLSAVEISYQPVLFDRWSVGRLPNTAASRRITGDLGIYLLATSGMVLGVILIPTVAGDLRHL